MLDNRYPFRSSQDFLNFEFESVGPIGIVRKTVRYTNVDDNLYNLGFGDKDEATGFIDDLAVTNNRDSRKVLATVAQTLYIFTEHYPHAIVVATGSTNARTRLYQMGIANNLTDIERDFAILGFINESWSHFSAIRLILHSQFAGEK